MKEFHYVSRPTYHRPYRENLAKSYNNIVIDRRPDRNFNISGDNVNLPNDNETNKMHITEHKSNLQEGISYTENFRNEKDPSFDDYPSSTPAHATSEDVSRASLHKLEVRH